MNLTVIQTIEIQTNRTGYAALGYLELAHGTRNKVFHDEVRSFGVLDEKLKRTPAMK